MSSGQACVILEILTGFYIPPKYFTVVLNVELLDVVLVTTGSIVLLNDTTRMVLL
jgi:hypothetical protein